MSVHIGWCQCLWLCYVYHQETRIVVLSTCGLSCGHYIFVCSIMFAKWDLFVLELVWVHQSEQCVIRGNVKEIKSKGKNVKNWKYQNEK